MAPTAAPGAAAGPWLLEDPPRLHSAITDSSGYGCWLQEKEAPSSHKHTHTYAHVQHTLIASPVSMGNFSSRLAHDSPIVTAAQGAPGTSTAADDHGSRLSSIRRRRSSAQSLPPRQRRRVQRLTESLRFWSRDDSPIASLLEEVPTNEDTSAESPTASFQLSTRSTGGPEADRFISELDGIASSLGGALNRGNTPTATTTEATQDDPINSPTNSLSMEHQIEMLSQLIELAATSTVRSLMGSTVANGRRFDNTSSRVEQQGDRTFQEFVTQLHQGLLGSEISRNSDMGAGGMSFFRAFRFDSEAGSIPTNPQFTATNTPSTPLQQPPQERPENDTPVVPVMIIGLRSVQQPRNGPVEDVDWFMRSNQSSTSAESEHQADPHVHARANGIDNSPDSATDQQQSWVIFVMGNSFAWNHPLLSAPSLMSENPTYEDLLTLQDLIGQVKPQVTTQEELDKHMDQLYEVSDGMASTDYKQIHPCLLEERCQVCLTDYQEGEIVRKLASCGHLYHQDCIDTWLLKGKNNCPLCRSKGVPSPEKEAAL